MRDESPAMEATTLGALTVEEFCETYKMGRSKFYGELRAGRLSAKKNGKNTIVLKSEAQRWEQSLPDYVPQ
jgi:hypothetical protein